MAQPDFGQDARLLRRAFAGFGGRPRRGRAAVQGGHRARPPEGRDRLDGRLRACSCAAPASASVDGALIIETSDEAASGRLIAAPARARGDPGGQPRRPRRPALRTRRRRGLHARTAPPSRSRSTSSSSAAGWCSPTATRPPPRRVEPAEPLGDSPDYTAAPRLAGRLRRLVLPAVAADPRPGRLDRARPPTRTGRRRSRYLEPLDALVGGTSGDGDRLKSAFKLIVK